MARIYRSRARRRTRRLAILTVLGALLAAADFAAGNPVLAAVTDASATVGLAAPPAPYVDDSPTPAATTGPKRGPKPGPTGGPESGPTGGPTGGPQSRPTADPTPAPPTTSPAPAPAPVPDPDPAPRRPITTVPAGSVALTIDDGPDPRWTPQVLDLLAAYQIHATFCLVGDQVRAHPDLVRRIAAEGHTLCDHTQTHDEQLPSRSATTIDREIRTAYGEIVAASGGVRPELFRAPGGNWSAPVIAAAARRGMRPLGWNVDPRDWTRPGAAAIAAAIRTAPSGAVILVHDGGGDRSQTVAALRTALPALRSRGLTFTTP